MSARDIRKVACYGAGTIGSSFAVSFALKGMPCNVLVRNQESAAKADAAIEKIINSLVEFRVVENAEAVKRNIFITTDAEKALAESDFIQESGPESFVSKRGMLEIADRFAPRDAIFATSSSGLLITELAKFSINPHRCIGAHPVNPPHLIPLIEITKSEKTSRETIDSAVGFYRRMGKEPIVLQKEKLGFVADRLTHALLREEIALVTEGVVTMEEAEKAVSYGPGLRWAIFGPAMSCGPGGGQGSKDSKLGAMTNMIFEDISDMKRVPDGWPEASGAYWEKAGMPDFIGHKDEDIARFRDYMLIEILKLHKKL